MSEHKESNGRQSNIVFKWIATILVGIVIAMAGGAWASVVSRMDRLESIASHNNDRLTRIETKLEKLVKQGELIGP